MSTITLERPVEVEQTIKTTGPRDAMDVITFLSSFENTGDLADWLWRNGYQGVPASAAQCPLARAIRGETGLPNLPVSVANNITLGAFMKINNTVVAMPESIMTPDILLMFMSQFD